MTWSHKHDAVLRDRSRLVIANVNAKAMSITAEFFAPLKLLSVNESLGLIHSKREKTNPKTKRSFSGCCLWMSTSRIGCNNFDIIRFRFRWISFAVTSLQPFLFHIWTQLPFHYTYVIYWKSYIWRFCFATVSGYIYCTVHIMVIDCYQCNRHVFSAQS